MKWFKQLFCRHNWFTIREQIIRGGMGRVKDRKCTMCGKEETKIVKIVIRKKKTASNS